MTSRHTKNKYREGIAMGRFSTLFSSKGDRESSSTKVRQDNENTSRIVADRITPGGGEKHVHEGYKLDTSSGSYREYSGGENSGDRSYNKDK